MHENEGVLGVFRPRGGGPLLVKRNRRIVIVGSAKRLETLAIADLLAEDVAVGGGGLVWPSAMRFIKLAGISQEFGTIGHENRLIFHFFANFEKKGKISKKSRGFFICFYFFVLFLNDLLKKRYFDNYRWN